MGLIPSERNCRQWCAETQELTNKCADLDEKTESAVERMDRLVKSVMDQITEDQLVASRCTINIYFL